MFLFVGASQISFYISAFVLGTLLLPISNSFITPKQLLFSNLSIWLSMAFLSLSLLSCAGTELLSKTMRVVFTALGAFFFYCIGYMTLPWIAYGIREWRTLLAVLSMTSVIYIPLWWSVA